MRQICLFGFFAISLAICAPKVWPYGASSTQPLVPAAFQQKKDKLGFLWDVTTNGRLQYGTNRVFNGCGYLQVNGSGFSTSSSTARKMTPDGSEFFLTRTMSGVNVTRRIKVDTKTSTVRYVEIFENSGTSPVTLTVTLGTSLRVSPQAVITDKGTPVKLTTPPGTPFIGRDETGIVAFRSQAAATPYGNQPSILFFLAGKNGKVRPSRNNSGNQQSYVFLYRFVVPPKKKAAVLHGVAQRNFKSKPSSAELAKQFRVFQSASWTRDLPVEVRRSIVNAVLSNSTEQPTVNVLQATTELAEAWSVERGDKDVLVFDEDTNVAGSLAGKSVSVATRFGDATVPIDDVAAIVGTAGEGRPTRVHLRNGEILAGPLRFEALRFNSDADLQFELQPEQLNVLLTRIEVKDDTAKKPDVPALLKTRHGDRIAVSNVSDLELSLVTAFGPDRVSLGDVLSAVAATSPQPIYRLVLKDGSRLSAMIRFGDLAVETQRFGTQPIESSMIASFVQLGEAVENVRTDSAAQFKLNGENVLVGKPVAAELTVATAAGEIPVNTSQIRKMTRVDQSNNISPEFEFEMADGSKFEGRFVDSLLEIRSARRTWQLQVAHIASFVQPDSQVAEARRLAEELDSLEVPAVAQRLKELAEKEKLSLAAMTLREMGEEKSRAILDAAKKLDAKFAESLSESMQDPKEDDGSEVEETKQDKPPTPQPTIQPPSATPSDPFGRADPFGGGPDPFGRGNPLGGDDPFAKSPDPFGAP